MHDVAEALGRLVFGGAESAKLRDRLVKGLSGLLGLRVTFSVLTFCASVILARLLGREGFGEYSYAFAWIVLLAIPSILGLDQLLVRQVATYQARSEWGALRGLLHEANKAVLGVSLSIALLAAFVAWVAPNHWHEEMLLTFWTALILLPLITLTRVRQGAMQGLHRVALGCMPEQLIQPALFLVLLGAVYFLKHTLKAPLAIGLNVVCAAIAFLVGARLLQAIVPRAVRETKAVYQRLPWTRSALPLMLLAGAGVIFAQADTLILGMMKGPQAVGVYSVADKGAELIQFVFLAQVTALASTAAALYAEGDVERLQRLVTKISRWTLLASLPAATVMIGLGHWFLLYCYGSQFVAGQKALAILGLGQLINVAMGAPGMLLIMTKHERSAAGAIGVGAAANIALNCLLIPRWGLEGAAMGNTISIILWNVLMAVLLYRKIGLHSSALGRAARA